MGSDSKARAGRLTSSNVHACCLVLNSAALLSVPFTLAEDCRSRFVAESGVHSVTRR
jgi:hypothetical protein